MGQEIDFHIKKPENHSYVDDERALTWAMFDYAFNEPIRCGKNRFVLLTGGSREGKSATAATIIEELLKRDSLELKDYVDDIFIYTPFEYRAKMTALLEDPRLKKIHFAVLDDARFTVSAKNWYSLINRSIADISSISGRQKPIVFIICTQYLSDLDKDMRRFLNYWGSCYRPLHKPTELKLSAFWHDERDPENVRLKKRPFKGIVVDGKRYLKYTPSKFLFHMPSKEAWRIYDENSFRAKASLLAARFQRLMDSMEKEDGVNNRVDRMVEYYSKPEMYEHTMTYFTYKYKKLRLKKDSLDFLKLNREEGKEFTQKIGEQLKLIEEKEMRKLESEKIDFQKKVI